MVIFGHLGLRNPWTDSLEIWHEWLRQQSTVRQHMQNMVAAENGGWVGHMGEVAPSRGNVFGVGNNVWSLQKWLNLIIYPKNMCIDTKIILILCVLTEISTKTRFSVMAALICKLCGLPKGDRVASSRFLKSTSRRYRNSKKNLYGPYCKVVQKSGVWQPD